MAAATLLSAIRNQEPNQFAEIPWESEPTGPTLPESAGKVAKLAAVALDSWIAELKSLNHNGEGTPLLGK